MDFLIPILSVASILLAALLITRATRPAGLTDWVLFLVPILSGLILVAGYLLSALNLFGSIRAWAVISGALSFVAVGVQLAVNKGNMDIRWTGYSGLKLFAGRLARNYTNLALFEKLLLTPCILVVVLLGAINLGIVINTAPHNWDSMTCHLARMAYYLQYGNLDYYNANYWAQAIHPKVSTILFSFAYLVTDRNENFTQLIQYISYWVAMISVYGISRCIGGNRFSSIFAGLVFGLLVECLMQAITTQSDMLVAAYVGCAVYGLFAWRKCQMRKYLVLTSFTTAIALGVKSSVLLVIPSLAVLAVYVVIDQSRCFVNGRINQGPKRITISYSMRKLVGDISVLLVSGTLSAAVFLLPSGYVENWQKYDNPIGPEFVSKEHSFQGKPLDYVLRNGTRNMLRYGFEFLTLDGLPSEGVFEKTQHVVKGLIYNIILSSGLDLESIEATRLPFNHAKQPQKHEDMSYWGIFGFGLIWPLVLLSLLGVIHSLQGRMMSLATLLFLVAQSYSGAFDPWRGRYFIIAAVFAVPVLSVWIRGTHSSLIKSYLIAIVLLGCFSGLVAVFDRDNSAPREIFLMDRIGQLTRNRKDYTEPIRTFNQLVPKNATVAVIFGAGTFEYPLFGKGITRRLIPVNGFEKGLQPLPPEAEYLIYSAQIFKDQGATDVYLGKDWYLRAIKKKPVR